jgi:pSer/pThr/pTyr-binding forkhead associated (FHA) protein
MFGFITRSKETVQPPPAPQAVSRHNPAHQAGFRHAGFKQATLALSAELVIEMPSTQGRLVKIDQPAMIIGRAKSVDITLDAPVVSRQHARLERIGDEYWITDLGSSNGTLVNGAEIGSVRLQNGDLITLGYNSAYPISIIFRVSTNHGGSVNWLN